MNFSRPFVNAFVGTIAVTLIGTVLLAACTPEGRNAQRDVINDRLPRGCVMRDVGEYASISHVVVVICEHANTTTTSGSWFCGKNCTHYMANTVIENEE